MTKASGLTFRLGHWETALMAANATASLSALVYILYTFDLRGAEFLLFTFTWVFVLSSLLVYWRARAVLVVTKNGIFQRYVGSSQHVTWPECSEFRVANFRRFGVLKGEAVVFDEPNNANTKRAKKIRRRLGATSYIFQNFGMAADELAALLNERRAEALANS